MRLEDRAEKKQISKLDYAVGHNSTVKTPGTHFVWLRDPLDRDISHYNYDMGKGDIDGDSFVDHCHKLSGNFMTLWLYKNYLCLDHNVAMQTKYNTVRQTLHNSFRKVFSLERFEESWDDISDLLQIDREPRLNTNRSNEDYKKFVNKNNLSDEFISWHRLNNSYDYKLFEEFCA